MKKQDAIPIVGILAGCLLIVSFAIRHFSIASLPKEGPESLVLNAATRVIYFIMLLMMRFIVVNISKQEKYRIVFDLILLFQLLEFSSFVIQNCNLLPPEISTTHSFFLSTVSMVIATVSLALYCVLLVSFIRTKVEKIAGLVYLKFYFGIVLLINFIGFTIAFVVWFHQNPAIYFQKVQPFFIVEYFPLLIFFYKNLNNPKNNPQIPE
jgi:hypothetical protein